MTKNKTDNKKPKFTPKEMEATFIDRFVELIFMQVEATPEVVALNNQPRH